MNTNTSIMTFQGVELTPLTRDSQTWFRLPQIEAALGYANKGKALATIFARHADEFTKSMTRVLKLKTAGGMQPVRIFSLRGAHLLAMFARTDVAKAFRVWVLNILDAEVAKPAHQQIKTYHFPIKMAVPHDSHPGFGSETLVASRLLDQRNRSPELELMDALERDGHDVSGARIRIIAFREALYFAERKRARMSAWESKLNQLKDEIHAYQGEQGISVLHARVPDPNNTWDALSFPHQMPRQEAAA